MVQVIAGIGVDLCKLSRIEDALKSEHFKSNVFSLEEIAYCESRGVRKLDSYASCFAAREAFVKASGASLGAVMLGRNFALLRNEDGAPEIRLSGELAEYADNANIHISLTHEGDYACAMVVIEKLNNEVVSNDDTYNRF
ncbi:MAG: holo-ACP synthase [Synergistaceae bacterium]|nr:holo-ACP synthase [Synergistaceae bacterium]